MVSILMVVIIGATKFPTVELKEDEKVGAMDTHIELLKQPMVILYFLGIFCYVGMEQGVSYWISEFLLTYHNIDPQTQGANTISAFWGLMTAGTALGLVLLKFVDSRKVLVLFSAAAAVSLALALFGSEQIGTFRVSSSRFFCFRYVVHYYFIGAKFN